MRDDELRERLRDCNPWWREATAGGDALAWVASDQMLRARAAYDLGYRSGLLDDVADGPVDDKLVVLRGARRIGKSVLLKDTVQPALDRGLATIQKNYANSVKRGRMTEEFVDERMKLITPTLTWDGFEKVDLLEEDVRDDACGHPLQQERGAMVELSQG